MNTIHLYYPRLIVLPLNDFQKPYCFFFNTLDFWSWKFKLFRLLVRHLFHMDWHRPTTEEKIHFTKNSYQSKSIVSSFVDHVSYHAMPEHAQLAQWQGIRLWNERSGIRCRCCAGMFLLNCLALVLHFMFVMYLRKKEKWYNAKFTWLSFWFQQPKSILCFKVNANW